MVNDLLEREAHQSSPSDGDVLSGRGVNAVWRRKVIHWYFTLIAALRRQHSTAAAASDDDDANDPFNRSTVHVTAFLLDSYLMSLPSERALRFKNDRPAYQLLATTCLLLGMRLARHDDIKESRKRDAADGQDQEQGRGMKRAKTHKMNMNEASAIQTTEAAAAITTPPGVAMPNAATILRISAAPRSLSERHVVSMAREVGGSRSFPRSKVVTALDFIQALGAASTQVGQDGGCVSLGPTEVEQASRAADSSLRDVSLMGCRPSVVACAAITLALVRSDSVDVDMSTLRHQVQRSIFGSEEDPALQVVIMKAEASLLTSIQVEPPSRNGVRRVLHTTTSHLIPLEDE